MLNDYSINDIVDVCYAVGTSYNVDPESFMCGISTLTGDFVVRMNIGSFKVVLCFLYSCLKISVEDRDSFKCAKFDAFYEYKNYIPETIAVIMNDLRTIRPMRGK